jgi:hypothetical protein
MCSPTLPDTRSGFSWDDPRITWPRPAGETEHLQGLLRRRQRISKSMSADRRLLGRREYRVRLFEGFDQDLDLEVLGTWSSQYATHVRYAVRRAGQEYPAH